MTSKTKIQIDLGSIHRHKHEYLSILSVILPAEVDKTKIFIGGGAIRSIMTGEKVMDIDVFFGCGICFSQVISFFCAKGYKKIFECPEKKLFTYKIGIYKVQLINKRLYSDVWDLLDSFDFTVTQFALFNNLFCCTRQAIKDTHKRVLRINALTYPVATINRLYKYKRKGYASSDCLTSIVKELVYSWDSLSDEQALLYID